MFKDICALVVAAIMTGVAWRYGTQIHRREIEPPLSTWILFLVGVGVSLLFYGFEEDWDLVSGITNVVDVGVVLIVLVCILLWGDRTVRFKRWERYYLAVGVLVVFYGFISGDLWQSSLIGQALLVVGYIPIWHGMMVNKRNTESFTAWCMALVAALVAIVPSVIEGNFLSAIYVIRALISILITLAFMTYYQRRTRRRQQATG
ncbi:MAG: hypothetical protein WC654_02580 [Patescibacteria group bacterium]